MDEPDYPYFFPEALRISKRLNERERKRDISENDRDFFRNLFFANAAGRKAQSPPMLAERLLIKRPGQEVLELAGAFMMSSEGDYTAVFFYGPETGLEKYSDCEQLINELESRLRDDNKNADLLHFLSIDQRAHFDFPQGATLTRQLIEGNVFDEQRACIERYQNLNVQTMLDELSTLPLIETLLDQLLDSTLRGSFSQVEQRTTYVFFYALGASPSDPEYWVNALPLRDALLLFYRQQSWPVGQRREFLNPAVTVKQSSNQQTRWEAGIKQAALQLHGFLHNSIETYWNTDVWAGCSRRAFFAQAMSDKSRADLLYKRQQDVISAKQRQQLEGLYQPEKLRVMTHIEKVRIWEYYPHYVELASTVIITNGHAYLYTQSRGLQVLKDYDDLLLTLKAMAQAPGHENDFFGFLALEERARFVGMKNPNFSAAPISGPIFKALFEDIVVKQQQNLDYCLDIYRRNLGAINAYALLDHGLDIRVMLDHRLLALEAKGRWSTHPVAASIPAEKARRLIRQLHSVDHALDHQLAQVSSFNTLISDQLNATFGEAGQASFDAQALYINHYAGNADDLERRTPRSSQDLLSHCLARLTGETKAIPETQEYSVYGPRTHGQATKIGLITIARFNALVTRLLLGLSRNAIAQLPMTGLEALKSRLGHVMSIGILEEGRLRLLEQTLDERDMDILQTALNPDKGRADQRDALNGFTPDAFALSVIPTGQSTLLRLANCFVLTERGGLDQYHSGHAVLWTPATGVEAFASILYLRKTLEQRLRSPSLRLSLLENLEASQHYAHKEYELGPLQLISDAILPTCQQSWIDHYIAQRKHTLEFKANAQTLVQSLGRVRNQAPANNLQRAIGIARLAELRHTLHDRLGSASPREQQRQAEMLEQYRANTLHGRDYLYEFYPLRQHVEDRLNDLLVDYSLFASEVSVVPRLALAGQQQNLVGFAMSPASLQSAGFDVVCNTTRLTETLVRQMLTQLKIHDDYHDYVNERLSADKPGVAQRIQDFSQQLPWQLLQYAHALLLQERLSERGFDLIQQAVDMPDAIARAALEGTSAKVRPLQLIATPGATITDALGMYLISAGREGPQVLYVPYHPTLSLSEYESEVHLLAQLSTPGALQDWVIRCLPAPQDATYRNLLAAHQDEDSEITLGLNPIQGNLFEQLFDDNRKMLLKLLGTQATPGAELEWESVKKVFSGGVGRSLSLLPGKLALPWIIWQSLTLFMTSAQDLQDHRWGEALQAFISGLATMAQLGQALREAKTLVFTPEQQAPAPELQPSVSWPLVDITAPERTGLQAYTQNDVALVNMTRGTTTGLYQYKGRSYIPLAGKVYRVESAGEFWRITTEKQKGPLVCLNALGQWVIDTRKHITRYGQAYGRLQDRSEARASARLSMNIEAVGMSAIRNLYPDRALMIVEALDLATYYLQNCKLNLALLEPGIAPVTRIHRFVNSFFGIDPSRDHGPQELAPALVQKLHRIVDLILGAALDPGLYSPNSKRFVVGSHRQDPAQNWGFTIDNDPEHRIYLTENFFSPPLSDYDNRLTGYFNRNAHARATVLIHELSHLAAMTADAAYLNSIMPFSDLIETLTQDGRDLLKHQKDLQTKGYSRQTPITKLFKSPDISGKFWTDFGTDPQTQHIKEQILSTTGGVDLSNARGIFMTDLSKRVDTILDNADSVALLITHLGRQLDPVPSSRRPSTR